MITHLLAILYSLIHVVNEIEEGTMFECNTMKLLDLLIRL